MPITPGTLTIESSDGTIQTELVVGGSYQRGSGVEHNVVNLGTDTVAFVEIELLEHQG